MDVATPAEYGAAYLDEHDPGWAHRIDLSKLDLRHPTQCILGQLYSKRQTSGYSVYHSLKGQEWLFRLGFDVDEDAPTSDMWDRFAILTAEWSGLVKCRQAQPIPTTYPQEVTTHAP